MEKNFLKNKNIRIFLILTITLVVIAQAITIYVSRNIQDSTRILIENVLNLTYVENTGGAFGIGKEDTLSFILVSIIIIGIILHFVIAQRDSMGKITVFSLSLITAGGISNLIDRISKGVIIDYIDFSPIIKFPVFNLADSAIFIGWLILIVSTIVFWKNGAKEINEKRKMKGFDEENGD